MSSYLHKVNSVEEAPISDAFLIYTMTGGIFYIQKHDYPAFAHHWSSQNYVTSNATVGLASLESHSVVLDLDFNPKLSNQPAFENLFPLIQSHLKQVFLPQVKHFTYLIATRPDSPGIHIHLPEFTISHDDYILLCQYLQPIFHYQIPGKGSYELDILQNATLPGGSKPDCSAYEALQLHYVDEKQSYCIDFREPQFEHVKKHFKRVKMNDQSFFRHFLFVSEHQIQYQTWSLMMPSVAIHTPLYKLCYATVINDMINESQDMREIATFTYKNTGDPGYVHKGKQLCVDGSHFLKAFHYLSHNSYLLSHLETDNEALRFWFRRSMTDVVHTTSINPIFDALNQRLRENNVRFLDDSHPLKTILEYDQGYYFLPVFYTLCKVLNVSCAVMVGYLRCVLDPSFFPLLDLVERVDEERMIVIARDFTEDTIYFCGNNLSGRFSRMRDKLRQITCDSKRAFMSVTTPSQMMQLYRRIQESHFPIQVLRMFNSLRKPAAYIWNCLTDSWQEIMAEREKESHMVNLWQAIATAIAEWRKMGNNCFPEDEVMQRFNLGTIMSIITSDSHLERRAIQMDRHKWFVRLEDGLLDILTGHIGGSVPELYLSDRRLGIDVSRHDMMVLYNQSPDLERLYALLATRSFFLRYLKNLFTNRTDDLFITLHEMILEEMPEVAEDAHALSMMHFYVHLCKYAAFEYDLILYWCDVLASIFIATNYERKFFVCKGETCNGKSKLFEILGRVFGGYYHCIQSDNLKPSKNSGNATPDLASTIFNCRIVTSEELEGKLNENRVKQLTGNSSVTFRNMYEASQGGIPTCKLFTSTNNVPDCTATEAFQDRVTAIPFLSRFVHKPPATTSDQVRLNQYGKDELVVERSYMGCFLLLVYHLKKHMSPLDGLLHYRDEPDCVQEYTQLYLHNTDVYNQFKAHMDVQISEDHVTYMSDVCSAVRQFLKNTKNNTTPEADLIVKFEDEFGKFRRSSEFHVVSFRGLNMEESGPLRLENSALMEGSGSIAMAEPAAKKRKVDTMLVYYENVLIRNLCKTKNDN